MAVAPHVPQGIVHSTNVTVNKAALGNSIEKDAHGNVVIKDQHLKSVIEQSMAHGHDPNVAAVKVGVTVDF